MGKSGYSTHLVAACMLVVGLLLALIGQGAEGKFEFGKIAVSVGSAIMFIGVLHWLYDTFSKKALLAELTETILGTKSVAESGIADFAENSTDIKFRELINDTRSLRTLFNYNSRFLLDYQQQIEALLARGGDAEFIFLSPNSSTIEHMKQLGWAPTSMDAHYEKIKAVAETWKRKYGGKIQVKYVDALLKYSVVQMDTCMFLIMSTCTNQRQTVPAIRINPRSPLWKFVSGDLGGLTDGKPQ